MLCRGGEDGGTQCAWKSDGGRGLESMLGVAALAVRLRVSAALRRRCVLTMSCSSASTLAARSPCTASLSAALKVCTATCSAASARRFSACVLTSSIMRLVSASRSHARTHAHTHAPVNGHGEARERPRLPQQNARGGGVHPLSRGGRVLHGRLAGTRGRPEGHRCARETKTARTDHHRHSGAPAALQSRARA